MTMRFFNDETAPCFSDTQRLLFRSLCIALVSATILLCSWLYFQLTENQVVHATDQWRQSRVLVQRAEQRLQHLKDVQDYPLTRSVGEDIDVLQIRLAEYLRQYGSSDDVTVQAFEQSVLPVSLNSLLAAEPEGADPQYVQILRLTVDVRVSHTPSLLFLISGVEKVLAGWPLDVRACDIQKTPLSRLNASCVMDIYYWVVDSEK